MILIAPVTEAVCVENPPPSGSTTCAVWPVVELDPYWLPRAAPAPKRIGPLTSPPAFGSA
ncbi:hypothetical protein D3C73_1079240 [compost metagenome]